jgi:hypothetical protein
MLPHLFHLRTPRVLDVSGRLNGEDEFRGVASHRFERARVHTLERVARKTQRTLHAQDPGAVDVGDDGVASAIAGVVEDFVEPATDPGFDVETLRMLGEGMRRR